MLQAEDEIAGIGAALGASFGGKKAMTATSGPGMSLKTELIGLATIAELPLVIVNVQRGGAAGSRDCERGVRRRAHRRVGRHGRAAGRSCSAGRESRRIEAE